jgi:glycerol-3-phosphate acyltransferase PlsX
VLDLGANVDCTPEHLLQFAVMGSALVSGGRRQGRAQRGPAQHRRRSHQGQRVIKRAGELLRAADAAGQINFHGNVEGNDIFKGTPTWWSATASSATWRSRPAKAWPRHAGPDFIRQEFTRNLLTKLAALVAMPVLKRFKDRVDHRRYNGAALLGLRGLVFKSHGSADAFAFEHALARAYDAARNRLLTGCTTASATLARIAAGRRACSVTRRSPPSRLPQAA